MNNTNKICVNKIIIAKVYRFIKQLCGVILKKE